MLTVSTLRKLKIFLFSTIQSMTFALHPLYAMNGNGF